ncbi:MAG: DUF928 domain-containing protein [Leptolyngbyaceae cyanobacterium SM1_4_3]|nr:DUF928 domain-containing protein [Leptolyngbyaceae cyanobacterium SM1_4_3]
MWGDRQFIKFTCTTLLISILFTPVVVSLHHSAFAQTRNYIPPEGGSPPSAPGIGGVRSGSCTGATNTAFTALAPSGHVGQTALTHPTFAWYVPDSQSLTIDFRLYVYGADGRLQPQPVYRTELNSAPGIMLFTLPETEPELLVGQRYYWRAGLVCDPNHGSETLIVDAEMQVVEGTVSQSERWYDLLRETQVTSTSEAQSLSALLLELAALENCLQ